MLQAFEALLTLELTVEHGVKEGHSDFDRSLQLYRTVAGVSLLACSCFYILGGVLCFGRVQKGRLVLRKQDNWCEQSWMSILLCVAVAAQPSVQNGCSAI